MKSERLAGDEPDLGVELFDAGVGQAVLDRREDPVTLHDDRAGELDERRQPAPPRPLQPTVEQSLGGRGRELVNLAQLFLEQVGAVEPGVGALDLSELGGLAVGEVLGVLPDREPGALQLPGELEVALPAGFVSDLPADLVQRVGRQLDHVVIGSFR